MTISARAAARAAAALVISAPYPDRLHQRVRNRHGPKARIFLSKVLLPAALSTSISR